LREGLGSQNVRSLLEATNGDLWIGLESPSGLRRFRNGKFDELIIPGDVRSIRALVEGPNETIWAGTSDGYILRVNGTNIVTETGAQDKDEERAFSVRCLLTTADGSLWIGYAGWGVGRWHNNHYTRVSAAQGLYDDYISQMLDDGSGGLWLTGNRGLFQVRREELAAVAEGRSGHLRSIAYGRNEGLPSVQPVFDYSPTAWRANDGKLWFATRNGLLMVQPDKIHDNPVAPPVLLTEVKVDDRLMALHDSRTPLRLPEQAKLTDLRTQKQALDLPPGHVKLEFAFTALSFNSPENVHFRYRLKGFDTEWVEAGPQRNAKYPMLPASHYEFELTACNEAGVWSETSFRLPLVVHPFFWQTWWFQLGVAGTFTAAIIGLVRYFSFRRLRTKLARLEQAEVLHRERARIARDMHDEVGSKLSRLSLLSEMVNNQPEMPAAAHGDVAEIAETARDTIRSFEEIVWAVNPKNDSLPQLMNYLCRFAEDFFEGSPTQCVFDLPEAIPDIQLPTEARHHVFLAAKEALNNVFKHARARRVCVQLTITPSGFEVTIGDDGCGLKASPAPPRAGTGNGLDNMRERMRAVGGELEMTSRPKGGTRVVLRIAGAWRAPD
jgi:signal transduction histidine kinase